ncbi:hypothetical protein C8F04DRAFT_1283620 [Mycena alexandri]|uniref:Uncharacterized protein n=1 Tax=Mycena alexandri TaxID=1745969 RepID=A0AAD6RX84_9AGAR|nr:hypothetical protein C8F04DRAFT_1283620 [Mycena alexandri]
MPMRALPPTYTRISPPTARVCVPDATAHRTAPHNDQPDTQRAESARCTTLMPTHALPRTMLHYDHPDPRLTLVPTTSAAHALPCPPYTAQNPPAARRMTRPRSHRDPRAPEHMRAPAPAAHFARPATHDTSTSKTPHRHPMPPIMRLRLTVAHTPATHRADPSPRARHTHTHGTPRRSRTIPLHTATISASLDARALPITKTSTSTSTIHTAPRPPPQYPRCPPLMRLHSTYARTPDARRLRPGKLTSSEVSVAHAERRVRRRFAPDGDEGTILCE